MPDRKFGTVYEWQPRTLAPIGDHGILVMYVGAHDRTMDSGLVLAMPYGPDERLGKVVPVWRVEDHESWKAIDG